MADGLQSGLGDYSLFAAPRQSQMTIPRAGIRFSLLATALLSTAAAAQQQIAVPAFFPLPASCNSATPPGTVAGCTIPTAGSDWSRILAAGSVVKIVVAELDNLGPGDGVGDCTKTPQAMFGCLRQRNHTMTLGYVQTLSARRDSVCPFDASKPLNNRLCNVVFATGAPALDPNRASEFSVAQWYPGNQNTNNIDGIFFDVGPSSTDLTVSPTVQQAYYQDLYQYVRNNFPGGCGGHACVMVNAAQFAGDAANNVSGEWVVNAAADFAVLWERQVHGPTNLDCLPPHLPDGGPAAPDAQDYLTAFCPFGSDAPAPAGLCEQNQFEDNWYFSPANTPRIAHVLSSAVASDVDQIVARSRSAYGTPAMLYILDSGCDPNKPGIGTSYNHLSGLFEQLATALAPGGGTPPPSPPATTPIDSGSMMVLIQGILDGPPAVSAPPTPPPPDGGTPNPPPEGAPGHPPTTPGPPPPPSNPND
jgi:hypothetical protein